MEREREGMRYSKGIRKNREREREREINANKRECVRKRDR